MRNEIIAPVFILAYGRAEETKMAVWIIGD